MSFIRLIIKQPVTVTVGVILIILSGLIAIDRIPIQLTPQVETMVITISTFWEGASPAEVELNVIDKQEERLTSLTGLRLMTSESSQSQGTIRLEFVTGTDKDAAVREVVQKLNEVPSYPEGVDEPVIATTDRENRDYIAWIVFGTTDPDFDIRKLRDFATDRIEPELERIPGVAEINVLGGREREVQVRFDPIALAQFGVTPADLADAIRRTNRDVSAGRVADGKVDVRLRTIGRYATTDDVANTVIADTESGPVFVRDVAEVILTYKEPGSFVRSKGRPVIAINAEREIGSNVMEVMAGLQQEVARLNAPGGLLETEARRLGLNGNLTLTQVYDQTIYIDEALSLVRNNIWIGGGLAVLVLLLFLRSIRSVGIVALAIPISVIGAVVAMVAMGRSINVVSLAGMAFAVGMVVDNAIVVLENIFRHLEMGKSRAQAAFDGTREVWGAVLASTLTTIAVFIPILLIQEEAGQLFRDIALAICAAVGLSLLVSITVIPTSAARLLKAKKRKAAVVGAGHRDSKWTPSSLLSRFIYFTSGSVIARVVIVGGLTAGSILGTLALMPPIDYLPRGNRNLVFGLIIPPPGYNLDQMEVLALRIEETVRPYWEAGDLKDEDSEAYEAAVQRLPAVPTFNWMTQSPGEPVVPPTIENYFLVSFEGILFHGGVSDDPERVVDLLPLFSHATRSERLPGAIAFPFQVPLFQLGGSTGSAVKLQLAGPDLDEVNAVAGALYQQLGQKFGFQSIQPVPSNFMIRTPEVQVIPDLIRAGEVGLTTSQIGVAVMAAGDGAIIDEFKFGGETIDLKIITKDAVDRQYLGEIADFPVATPSGQIVPLGSVANVTSVRVPETIARVGRQRSVSFQVTAPEGVALEEMMLDLEAMIDEQRQAGVIPASIATSMAGTASKLAEVRSALLGDGTFLGTLTSSMVLALMVVYLLMCVLFQSFLKPLVIMFSVPLALLGGFAALFAVFIWSVTDPYLPMQTLDVVTMLGFVILIGVVVNNAILIVHQAGNFMSGVGDSGEAASGNEPMPARRAIAESVRTRVRPVFMSTLTSVGGMLPLVLMPGSGSELYRGLGSVVVGGLLVSTIFTIVLVPLLLSLAIDAQEAVKRLFSRKEHTEAATATPPRAGVPAPSPHALRVESKRGEAVPASATRSSDA